MNSLDELLDKSNFSRRHIGPSETPQREMLATVGAPSIDALVREVVPHDILLKEPLALGEAKTENEALAEISAHAAKNEL